MKDIAVWGRQDTFANVTGETVDGVIEAIKLFKDGLIGMDPLDIEKIHNMMNGLVIGNTAAKAAIDIALYDIKGKILGAPLYKVLGGYDNKIQTDITISIDEPENMAMEAKQRVIEDGFKILKIKAGINPSDDIKALQLIRAAVGDDIRLRVDATKDIV